MRGTAELEDGAGEEVELDGEANGEAEALFEAVLDEEAMRFEKFGGVLAEVVVAEETGADETAQRGGGVGGGGGGLGEDARELGRVRRAPSGAFGVLGGESRGEARDIDVLVGRREERVTRVGDRRRGAMVRDSDGQGHVLRGLERLRGCGTRTYLVAKARVRRREV